MSLLTILQGGVKLIDGITKPLQPTVMYQHPSSNGSGGVNYASAVPLRAVVEYKRAQVRMPDGTEATVRAYVTLLDVAAIVAATGGNGISTDGIFTLPKGEVGPVLKLDGFMDAGTGTPVATEVRVG